MSEAATEITDSSRDSSADNTSMEAPAGLDVTSYTVRDMSETVIADKSTASSDASLDTTSRTVCPLDETVVLGISPDNTLDHCKELSSTNTDSTMVDVVDMSETVCLDATNDATEDTEAVMNSTVGRDAFSGLLFPEEDLGSDGSVADAERLRSRPSSEYSSVGSQVETSEGSDAHELSPIYRHNEREDGGDDDNPASAAMESPEDGSQASSNEDACYMPCKWTAGNGTATGRFLVSRDIPEPSSSTEDCSGSGFDDGFLYISDGDSMAKRSEDGNRCDGDSCVLRVGPKESTRMRSREASSFGSVSSGKPCTDGAPKNTSRRLFPISTRGAPLSPIMPTRSAPRRKDYPGRSHIPREPSPEERTLRSDDEDDVASAGAVGRTEEASQVAKEPVYTRHHDLPSGEDILDAIFARSYQDDVPHPDAEPGRRFFRYKNLKKTYMKHYLSNPNFRRICKHSEKYFENAK